MENLIIQQWEIGLYWIEIMIKMEKLLFVYTKPKSKFSNCNHDTEPGCQIKKPLEQDF